ncbi:hypothetical protein ACOSP7_023217 [Xanthoceras sorbifolium]
MKNLNQTLLAKAAWRLLQSDGSLWCELIVSISRVGLFWIRWKTRVLVRVFGKGSNMWLRGEEWNNNILCEVLLLDIVLHIISIQAGIYISGEDRHIWGLSKNGEFIVKSAYEVISGDCEAGLWNWHFIWKLKIYPKVQFFMWVLVHGKLLTNAQRYNRGRHLSRCCLSHVWCVV